MASYLKVEFTAEGLDSEQAAAALRSAIEDAFAEEGLAQELKQNDLIVNVQPGQDRFVVETAVVVAVIGLVGELVVLYRTLQESKLRQQEIDNERDKIALEREKQKLEEAKFYVQTLSEKERQQLIDQFLTNDLPLLLQKAGIQEVKGLQTGTVEQEG